MISKKKDEEESDHLEQKQDRYPSTHILLMTGLGKQREQNTEKHQEKLNISLKKSDEWCREGG